MKKHIDRYTILNKEWGERIDLAENPNTDPAILAILASGFGDESPDSDEPNIDDLAFEVRLATAENPSTPEDALRRMLITEDDPDFLWYVRDNLERRGLSKL